MDTILPTIFCLPHLILFFILFQDRFLGEAIKSEIDEQIEALEKTGLSENQRTKICYPFQKDDIKKELYSIKEKTKDCYKGTELIKLTRMKLTSDRNRVFIPYPKRSVKILYVKFIKEKFKAALIKHIETSDTSKVQDICLTFMEEDLQKKMVRANRAARVKDYILCVFFCGMIVGPVVSCVLYGITNKEMLLTSSIPIPLLAILSLCIVSLYELSTKNTVRNELEEIKKSLNLNCENNQLKSEQALTNSNLKENASSGNLIEATTAPQAQNSPGHSPSPQ
ncbi:MAG: hypothetical protein sL5_08530 [Candidatus Mesenet longicola]|uniref:Uncharacterized protein n=1 Tax=Candidatus Mesenet longicola TaxID=1892558 RepID=A0A8J3HVU7_9RICK|nr:MAG: hypothetical protein sGL2_08870 [Candidatus Mesenet longicola]GHM59860.1 MAG: hypothetical protein sL5_08530 [Candidatus Mesenet longicola]